MALVSQKDVDIIQVVVSVALAGPLCLLGVVFNVINIVVFLKQGLTNTVNISLFAIAIADICSLVALEWVNINLNPFMEKADIPYEPFDTVYLTGTLPHSFCIQTTIWIMVYVTIERFICIVRPLKVKQIFTPLRTKLFIILSYLLMLSTLSSVSVVFYFGDNFYSDRNETRVGLKMRNVTRDLSNLIVASFSVLKSVSFAVLVLFACLLIIALRRRLDSRKRSVSEEETSQTKSRKHTRAIKMVGLQAGVLIVCASPGICFSLAVLFVPGFGQRGYYFNIFRAGLTFATLVEAVNSSLTIVFFYHMSAKFKATFHELLSGCIGRCHGKAATKLTNQ